MKLKIQDALPILKEKNTKIKVFVSDMCLHEMADQLEFLLLAKDVGILEENAFFTLTLKCNSGFSKASFDRQVEKVLETLASKAETRMVSTYHLFSNRSGERTVLGVAELLWRPQFRCQNRLDRSPAFASGGIQRFDRWSIREH